MIRGLAVIKGYYDYGMFQAIQIAAIMALPGVRDVQVIRFGRQDGRPLVDPIPLAPTEVIEFSPAWLELTVEGGR